MTSRSEHGDDLLIPLLPGIGGVERQVVIRFDEFHWQFARSGGPGGQNVNKVSTKALLRWNPRQSQLPADVLHRLLQRGQTYLTTEGEMLITSQRHRTQLMNMQDCVEKLRHLIEASVKPPVIRRATRPTRGSKERRLQAKKQNSERRAQRRVRHED